MLDFISMVHTLEQKDIKNEANAFDKYLSIKWILCELDNTFKRLGIDLIHFQAVFLPWKTCASPNSVSGFLE